MSRRDQGDVLLLRDSNRDGTVDERKIVAQNLKSAHGLAVRGNQLDITSDKKVLMGDIQADGSLSQLRVIIDDLPDALLFHPVFHEHLSALCRKRVVETGMASLEHGVRAMRVSGLL